MRPAYVHVTSHGLSHGHRYPRQLVSPQQHESQKLVQATCNLLYNTRRFTPQPSKFTGNVAQHNLEDEKKKAVSSPSSNKCTTPLLSFYPFSVFL